MAFESSNSGGFGGSGPEGITHKFGMLTEWKKGSSDSLGLSNSAEGVPGEADILNANGGVSGIFGMLNASTALLKPILSAERPNSSCTAGLRRSASTSSVVLPVLAIKIARLAAMMLLPSWGTALVIIKECSGLSIPEKAMLVRKMR